MKLSVPQPEYIRFNEGTTAQNAGVTGTKVFADGRELAPGQQVATMPITTPQITSEKPAINTTAAPITLPEMFQQNYPMNPQQPQQGIKMPNLKKPLQDFDAGSNWTDFLTIALNNRYQM